MRHCGGTPCLAFASATPDLVVDYGKRKGSRALEDVGVHDAWDCARLEGNESPQLGIVVSDMAPIPADMRHENPLVVARGGAIPPGIQEVLEMLFTEVGQVDEEYFGEDLWRHLHARGL